MECFVETRGRGMSAQQNDSAVSDFPPPYRMHISYSRDAGMIGVVYFGHEGLVQRAWTMPELETPGTVTEFTATCYSTKRVSLDSVPALVREILAAMDAGFKTLDA